MQRSRHWAVSAFESRGKARVGRRWLGLAAAIVGGLAVAAPARDAAAARFDFTYTLAGGGVLTGQFEGDVDASDANILIVQSVIDPAFNGVAGPALPEVGAFSGIVAAGVILPGSGGVTFDGSAMDLIACDTGACDDGFLFGDLFTDIGSAVIVFGGGPSYGNTEFLDDVDLFDASRWSLTAADIGAVPLPATLPALIAAIGVLGVAAGRRRVRPT